MDPLCDPDIVRAARYMIARYGGDAERHARSRFVELSGINELNAAAIWKQVLYAIHSIAVGGQNALDRAPIPDERRRD